MPTHQILKALIKRGLTQADIGALAGMSRWAVMRWLKKPPPAADHALQLHALHQEAIASKAATARMIKRARS